MKHLFIINPAAGKKDQTAAYEAKIRPACEARGLDYEIAVSTHPGNCRTLARPGGGDRGGSAPVRLRRRWDFE